jgi:transposase
MPRGLVIHCLELIWREGWMTGAARVVRPDRRQLQWDLLDLDGLLAADHRARMVWSFVESLDLAPFYAGIAAREGEAGRPATDPAVLLALWLYATLDGVGSARELERLCERDVAYRWLRGGVPVNYHGLSDFRVGHGELLDRLLTESVAALLAEGLIDLDEVVVDGTKVKASAGRGSFVGAAGLERAERVAAQRIARLKGEVEGDPGAGARRKRAAQERAAHEIAARAGKARAMLERLRAEKQRRAKKHAKAEAEKGEAKVSLTDPEARRMRFADGSIKAGYNIPIAATGAGLVLAVAASDKRNDAGLARPLIETVAERYGRAPQRLLLDTNLATADDIVALAERREGAILIYAPPPQERNDVKPDTLRRRLAARAKEPAWLKEWRSRMAMPDAQAIYQRRRRIELVNAHWKNRGFERLNLRGLFKARIVALWHALAHNICVSHRLRLARA